MIDNMKSSDWDEHWPKVIWKLHPRNEWACLFELRLGTGYGGWAETRIDAFVINCYPSKAYLKITYEVKRTRADFFNEIKRPLKRHPALMFSNQFFFVTPVGLIKPEEIPQEAGLLEIYENGYAQVKLMAPYREAYPPVWPMFASVARRLDKRSRKILD